MTVIYVGLTVSIYFGSLTYLWCIIILDSCTSLSICYIIVTININSVACLVKQEHFSLTF